MWQVVGQTRAVTLLQRSLDIGTTAHAYVFVGPEHVGKMTLALNLAQALNCTSAERPCGSCGSCEKIAAIKHADVQIIGVGRSENGEETRSATEIGINQIREMQHSSYLPPFEGRYKVYIIDGAETLSNEAANCLLKTLEEPSDSAIFIMLTVNDGLLPETLKSRCQRLDLKPLPTGEIEKFLHGRGVIEEKKARLLARLSHGCPGWSLLAAFDDVILQQRSAEIERLRGIIDADYGERFSYVEQMLAQYQKDRESVHRLLDLWLDWWHDILLVKLGCNESVISIDFEDILRQMADGYSLAQIKKFIDGIGSAGEQIKQNVNPRLALEVLMLNIPGRNNG